MDNLILTSLLLGFTLGAAHAFDPDHLVAVGTLTAESKNARQASVLGVIWGVGHTLALAGAGCIVLSMKWSVPEQFSVSMEMIVGFMIILLGGNLLWKSFQTLTVHTHQHSHEGSTHAHVHIHGKDTVTHHHHALDSKLKTLLVGFVHGLAGSAALSLTVLSTMPTVLWGLTYIVIFGFGSIGGMFLVSTILSLPFVYATGLWHHQVKCGAGLLAIGFGGYLTWSLMG